MPSLPKIGDYLNVASNLFCDIDIPFLVSKMLFLKQLTLQRSSNLPRYEYAKLKRADEIRLIEIQPNRSQSSRIDCTLHTTSLSNPDRNYQCLSYVWGPKVQSKHIHCDNRALPVTDNLYTALKNLRHRTDSVTIWIDQISINQADLAERSQQVLLMADVYSKAENTIIWLGERAENSDIAMKVIQERGEHIPFAVFLKLVASDLSPTEFMTMELGLPHLSHKSWTALRKLLQRAWFKRTWVRLCVISFRQLTLIGGARSCRVEKYDRTMRHA